MCKLKHLAVAAAIIGLATQVQAGYFPGSTDFEDIDLADSDYWSAIGDATIETEATFTPMGGRATYRPSWFSTTNKVLSVDNDVETPIVCGLGGDSATASTIYADILVKGAPLANDASVPEVGSNDKILVYTRVNALGTDTNLCVLARPDANSQTNEYVLTKSIGKDEWHRIVIKADNGSYQVFCDDVNTPCSDGTVSTFYPINAVGQGAASMSQVAFAGTGAVDDLILSDLIPERPITTLTWDTSLANVSYIVGNETNAVPAGANGSYEFQPDGAVTLIGDTGYRTVTASGSAGSTVELTAPAGLAWFSADATGSGTGAADDPYTIPDYGTLLAMQVAVANDASFRSASYKQTADIDFTGKPAFAGIGMYGGEGDPTAGVPFTGTYDGQGNKISNIAFESKSYAGVFNQVNGGTIKNLTVENATGAKGISIVGNAGNGATLQNLVAEGSFGSAASPATHNAAGIVIRLSAGGTGTLVKDCTNNAAIYGNYTKLCGICALTQHKNNGGVVTFDGCANNGNLYLSRTSTGVTGFAGIVGYVEEDTTLVDCSNTGSINNTVAGANTDKNGALVGWAYGRALTDNGGNSAPAGAKMVGYQNAGTSPQSITGFKYATIDNGVATTVLPPLAAGATYLLEGNIPASATPVATLTAVGDTISFDTALGYTFAGTVANSDAAGIPSVSTNGTVITYTAGYFPRTATAGQDGSAAHPFELADADDLAALKAAFTADASWRSKNYKVVADIDATELGYWDGIGAQGTANSGLNGGTLDGDGHTITNLMFSAGKYRAFFNRMDNATIKNLTIHVADIQETDAEEHGYAAFVGNLKNSVLLNCTATGTIGTIAKPAMHTCGGFAVKTDAGAVFVNCTNHISIVCALNDNPKIGGIIGLAQGVSITNCWNDGNITIAVKGCDNAGNGAGGLVGYAQTSPLRIHNSGNAGTVQSTSDFASHASNIPIKVGTIVGMQNSSTATITGGTIAQADAAPAGARANITGLDFAIVDDNVATFVSTLEAGNTYKVMLSGVTATYAFTAPGTIAFDTALFTPTYAITAAQGLTVTSATEGTVTTYKAVVAADTWIGGASGNWNEAANWNSGFVPTRDTVATFTNSAEVAISNTDACKELVLSNANVSLVRHANATQPILRFYNNEERAVSVASGATGSLAVNGIALFNERTDSASLMIGCGFEILGDLTFRGVNPGNNVAASFTITNKTTISADANVKTIDHGTTKFLGGIEVAKGVTAKITTKPHGKAEIGTGVTLVANDGAGNPTAIWLMQNQSTSKGVSLTGNAKVAVDAAHDGAYYAKNVGTSQFDYVDCTVYEAAPKPTVVIVAEVGATLTGVTNGVPVTPGAVLSIGATGAAQGAEVTLTISNLVNDTVVTTTELPYSYTMPEYDAYVSVAAVQAPQGFNDPQGTPIEDPAVIAWLTDNGFTQADIDALGNNYAALEKFYEAYIVNYDFRVQGAGVALSFTDITVGNDNITVTVQLVRTAPLGAIHGKLYFYGATDLTAGFSRSPIVDTSVSFGETDETFDTTPTQGTVTQTATATLTFVSDKFFKAQIHAELPDNGE